MSHPAFLRAAVTAVALVGAVSCGKKAGDDGKGGGTLKLGVILSLSGPFADVAKQIQGGIKTYMKQHGDTVAGRKVEVLYRDSTGMAGEVSKRLAQELVVTEKVDFLTGFGLTPEALAAAPIATEGKTPMVIMNAATAIITSKSPYIVRFSLTLPQVSAPLGDWAAKNGIKKIATLVSDYGPGHDAEAAFIKAFTAGGGEIIDSVRSPPQNPEFAAFAQRIKDAHPDAVFVFVPAGQQSVAVMKSFQERGIAEAGIKLLCTGDLLDDHQLATIGDAALGAISTHHYSVAHDSPENKAFLDAYRDANGAEAGLPNFMSVAAYDAMEGIYRVVQKLGSGKIDADKAMEIFKGMSFTSPRGPIMIDPETRDIVQTVYLRKVEKANGELRNVEQQAFPNMKTPAPAPGGEPPRPPGGEAKGSAEPPKEPAKGSAEPAKGSGK
ncbi:MAG: ABC transporter substrate-binding protein [Deltaproteobacteria bacterium]|nr:MAG: ABC transporter substrate-binding protein [Deltaproteobacteria bacterium]